LLYFLETAGAALNLDGVPAQQAIFFGEDDLIFAVLADTGENREGTGVEQTVLFWLFLSWA
jgi:hypothetical protein